MAQIIIYNIDNELKHQEKYTVKCNNTETLLQYLQESAMIIINSNLLSNNEILFFRLLKLTFPYVTIADFNHNVISETFICANNSTIEKLIYQQLNKHFLKEDKKKLLKTTFSDIITKS